MPQERIRPALAIHGGAGARRGRDYGRQLRHLSDLVVLGRDEHLAQADLVRIDPDPHLPPPALGLLEQAEREVVQQLVGQDDHRPVERRQLTQAHHDRADAELDRPFEAVGVEGGRSESERRRRQVERAPVLHPQRGRPLDPGLAGSVNPDVVTGMLREDLGFQGVAITDSQGMAPIFEPFGPGEGAVRSLLAGNDLVLNSPSPAEAFRAIRKAVRSGRLPEERLVEAATRVVALRLYLDRLRSE